MHNPNLGGSISCPDKKEVFTSGVPLGILGVLMVGASLQRHS